MQGSVANITEKIQVGVYPADYLPGVSAIPKLIPGTSILNGPVYMGLRHTPGVPSATCMIGPAIPGSAIPGISLEVTGVANLGLPTGSTNIFNLLTSHGLSIFNGVSTNNSLSLKNGVDIKNALNIGNAVTNLSGVLNANGGIKTPIIISEVGRFNGNLYASSVSGAIKSFDIPHPSRERMRLRYACIEGPEAGVYYRGRLKDNNIIELPYYWRDLVDLETITVNLTSHTVYQELYVKAIEWGTKIIVANNLGGPIDCSYVIFAERKDIDKLVVEYEGELE